MWTPRSLMSSDLSTGRPSWLSMASLVSPSIFLGLIFRNWNFSGMADKRLFEYHIRVDIINSASRILQCWSYYVTINSARHQHEPKELKTERDCSHRQLFRPFWGSSVWRNNQRKLWRKISVHSDFKPRPRTLNTHRITPYHVSSRGQESKYQVDVSQRK